MILCGSTAMVSIDNCIQEVVDSRMAETEKMTKQNEQTLKNLKDKLADTPRCNFLNSYIAFLYNISHRSLYIILLVRKEKNLQKNIQELQITLKHREQCVPQKKTLFNNLEQRYNNFIEAQNKTMDEFDCRIAIATKDLENMVKIISIFNILKSHIKTIVFKSYRRWLSMNRLKMKLPQKQYQTKQLTLSKT